MYTTRLPVVNDVIDNSWIINHGRQMKISQPPARFLYHDAPSFGLALAFAMISAYANPKPCAFSRAMASLSFNTSLSRYSGNSSVP